MTSTTNVIPGRQVHDPLHTSRHASGSGSASVYRSTVLNHSADAVWAVIRDFNSYPAYIDGVTESYLEDNKAGDEVGCVRRFVYNGVTIRQTLAGHNHNERWFTHTGCEPLEWPLDGEHVGKIGYLNRIQVRQFTIGNLAFVEWSVQYALIDGKGLEYWTNYFGEGIPEWLASLRRHMELQAVVGLAE